MLSLSLSIDSMTFALWCSWAKTVVTGRARLGGIPVIVSMLRFVDFARFHVSIDAFNAVYRARSAA
jgi:hypothetical protein